MSVEQETAQKDRFQAEFEALPLDRKFASLFHMEVATLTETIEYVCKSPMEVVGKVGDAMSDFASKVESEFRKASARPAEPTPSDADSSAASTPGTGKRGAKPKGDQ